MNLVGERHRYHNSLFLIRLDRFFSRIGSNRLVITVREYTQYKDVVEEKIFQYQKKLYLCICKYNSLII